MKKLVWILLLFSVSCAKHAYKTDLSAGQIGYAVWKDCRLKPELGVVACKCSTFDMSMDAKTGNTILSCAK